MVDFKDRVKEGASKTKRAALSGVRTVTGTKHTSIGRKDDEPVPAIEKLRRDTDVAPATLVDLAQFGESTLQTGDVLIAHCTHTFGKLAQAMTRKIWDHVALIVRLDGGDGDGVDGGGGERDAVVAARKVLIEKKPLPPHFSGNDVPEKGPARKGMVWSLPGEAGPVEVFEAMGYGTYSFPFAEQAVCRGSLFKYTAIRRLRNNEGEPLGREAQVKIEEFVQEFWARRYEEGGLAGMRELAGPIFKRTPKPKKSVDKDDENLDNVFCSELVAEAYQRAGLLPEETLNSNDVLPGMFGVGGAIDKFLEAQGHGFKLGEVEIFKSPGTPLDREITERRAELWRAAEAASTD